MVNEFELKKQICEIGRRIYNRNMVAANDGNISVKLNDNEFFRYIDSKEKINNFRHGYAISIHKSQGSEFNLVIVPFVNSYKRMLYNKLIYTAVTRAKNKLILLGEEDAFLYSVNNDENILSS